MLSRALHRFRHPFDSVRHTNEGVRLANSSTAHLRRYEAFSSDDDLLAGVEKARQAVEVINHTSRLYATFLCIYAVALQLMYLRFGDIDFIERAIQNARVALSVTSMDSSKRLVPMNDLAIMLKHRFERIGNPEDINEAVDRMETIKCAMTEQHPKFGMIMSNYSDILLTRFRKLGSRNDLDRAIVCTHQAVRIATENGNLEGEYMYVCALCFVLDFQTSGSPRSLKTAVNATAGAIHLTPVRSTDYLKYLSLRGVCFTLQFELSDEIRDLKEAIEISEQILRAAESDSPFRTDNLSNLAKSLELRFRKLGKLEDLQHAIDISEGITKLPAENNLDIPLHLHNHGNYLLSRFERLGRLDDLDEAISMVKKAVELTPHQSPAYVSRLNTFSIMLETRFHRLRIYEDLNQAIKYSITILEKTPEENSDYPKWLNNLANRLISRYQHCGTIEDLNQAIEFSSTAINHPAETSFDLAAHLENLGNNFERRSKRPFGTSEDLEKAIKHSARAKKLTPLDSPFYARRLSSLGRKLGNRFDNQESPRDLKKSIVLTKEAVDDTAGDDSSVAIRLQNFAVCLQRRYKQNPNEIDERDITSALQRSFDCIAAGPMQRLHSATLLIEHFKQSEQWKDALVASESAFKLLPMIHSHALSLQDQESVLSSFSGLAVDACALQLQYSDTDTGSIEKALQLLESGRGAILGLIMDLRVDISKVRALKPEIADHFEQIQVALNSESTTDPRSRLDIVKEREDCLLEIREIPALRHFLKAPSISELRHAACNSYIILVNVTNIRSDAILVSKSATRIVPLPDLSYPQVIGWAGKKLTEERQGEKPDAFFQRNKEYVSFLSWLWKTCVSPILSAVDFESTRKLPRVWWIGTGAASTLPFHAAGDLVKDSSENTMSRVVSSYVPTIKSLIYARHRLQTSSNIKPKLRKLLLVCMPTTPNEKDLPGTEREVAAIEHCLKDFMQTNTLTNPTASEVLQQLEQSDATHFACHGSSDSQDPARSALILQKREQASGEPIQDLLTVEQLLTKSWPSQLAFLSACSTAENSAAPLADEIIHLASSFLIAGFSHVIGAMWPADDEVCTNIAKSFYTHAVKFNSKEATKGHAYSLHYAVLKKRSLKRNLRIPLIWAQYIHVNL
ncbi:hypothetical protein MMC11_008768 [Xylographa trunciseda]|nr:hypothetical protein [Xylographa trunciseda]